MTDRLESPIRNYGIDGLRIVSMLMIVMLHVLGHGGILDSLSFGSIKYVILWFFEIGCFCAVNCYALISGYVGVFSHNKFCNIILLWLRVVFYTLLFTLIFKVMYPDTVGAGDFIRAFFPIYTKQYWYFTAYVVLFFFMPLLNVAIKQLSKKQVGFFIISIVVIFCALSPLKLFFSGDDIFDLHDGLSAMWLMVCYVIGGYIRKYGFFEKTKTLKLFLYYLLSIVISLIFKTIMIVVHNDTYESVLISYTSITILFASVCLLLVFKRISFGKIFVRIISFLSPLAFSVYLIHENIYVKEYFITNRFQWVTQLNLIEMIILIIGIVMTIYIICSTIDSIRFYLFKLLKIQERLFGFENKLKNKKT